MMKKFFWIFFAVLLLWFGYEIYDCLTLADYGAAKQVNLTSVAEKEMLSPADYALIFSQTGLGKPAVDDLRESKKNFSEVLQKFQLQRFSPVERKRDYLFFPTTVADVLAQGTKTKTLALPPLKKGDILITKSTKTLMYRHGHAAIVTDGERGYAIEAMMLGVPSAITRVDGWESYATLMVLRPKMEQEKINSAVDYAKENLLGVPYHLLAGLFDKDQSDNEMVNSTHCSHLVWQAYRVAGVDLDSDSGWLVSPCDLAGSKDLEIVFSFGFGDDGKW